MQDYHKVTLASGRGYDFPTQFSAVAFALNNSLTQKATVLDGKGKKIAVFFPHSHPKPEHPAPNGPAMQREAEKARAKRLSNGQSKAKVAKPLKRPKTLKKGGR